jgi:hypothetical protein
MDQFIGDLFSNVPDDDHVPGPANKHPSGLDAVSFSALRRLYMQMGFLLHNHGIETLPQLDSLLKSAALKDVSPEGAKQTGNSSASSRAATGPTEFKPPREG